MLSGFAGLRGSIVTLLMATVSCAPASLEGPAEYQSPEPGTVYRYRDVANVILESDGIRTRFRDNQGRVAERVGLFLTDDPEDRMQIDTVALMSLWPLVPEKEAVVETKRANGEVFETEFRVSRVEPVETGMGMVDAIIVQGVTTPKLVRDPETARSIMNSWWYSPDLNAVVRFRTTFLAGPGQGTVVGDRLVEIMDEESYREWLKEQRTMPDSNMVIGDE